MGLGHIYKYLYFSREREAKGHTGVGLLFLLESIKCVGYG